tara:strand:+ start:132 stop:524 length:393 start_codon:yes stop_codon:yes gene_type:complete
MIEDDDLIPNFNMKDILKRLNKETNDQIVWDILMSIIKSGKGKIKICQRMQFYVGDVKKDDFWENDDNRYDYYNGDQDDYYSIKIELPIDVIHDYTFEDCEEEDDRGEEIYEYTLEEAFVLIKKCLSSAH